MGKGRRGSICFGVLVLLSLGTGAPAEAQELTLEQAAELALRENPAIQASESGERVADAQVAEARAGRLPSLQFSETYTNSNNPVFVFGSLLEQGKFGMQNFGIDSLNQPG